MEDRVELVGDCEADFDEGEEQAETCDGDYDGAAGTVEGGWSAIGWLCFDDDEVG